ncbi:hypothetical protein HK096_005413 [Nowakowskiella sp. JEL0078]|nr:hypothetical protein HK096_005413 [Nowakowskiella sp. JEL0078]
MSINGYVLKDSEKSGYDWWWHNLVAVSRKNGNLKPFFFEYYVVNPGLGNKDHPIIGDSGKQKPSYAMLMGGTWGDDACQLKNFYPVSAFSASRERMEVKIGNEWNKATETSLSGEVVVNQADIDAHPQFLMRPGSIKWNLKAKKILSFGLGYTTSAPIRALNVFEMAWHVQGMKTEYEGTIEFDGEIYDVKPETSYGYQDKNWGLEYTNPWIWLSCNKFTNSKGENLHLTSLDVGGGRPKLLNMPMGKQCLVAFYHESVLYEFNFTKLGKSQYNVIVNDKDKLIMWNIRASNFKFKIEIDFEADLNKMLNITYESPDSGKIKHDKLWNGGLAYGTVKLYQTSLLGDDKLIDVFNGDMGGCEFGEYGS